MAEALRTHFDAAAPVAFESMSNDISRSMEYMKQNAEALKRNESLSSSQNTLLPTSYTPSLIGDDESRPDSPNGLSSEHSSDPKTPDRFEKVEEEFRRQLSRLLEIEASELKWSGTGQSHGVQWQDMPDEVRKGQKVKNAELLGEGGFGRVHKVTCQKIPLARKTIVADTDKRRARAEAEVAVSIRLKDFDHQHLVRLVGDYCSINEQDDSISYHILTFPVADCDLKVFLHKYVAARKSEYQFESSEIRHKVEAAAAVEIPEHVTAHANIHAAVLRFLNRSMGCMADAVMWMHSENVAIAHQDLKPDNILLRNGRLYVTDFGLSRDRNGVESKYTTLVHGVSHGYSAPEIEYQQPFVPYRADVYSLGCIFLHIMSAQYSTTSVQEVTDLLRSSRQHREQRIHEHILEIAPPFPQTAEETSKYGDPRPPQALVELVEDMLKNDEDKRPKSAEVNKKLREIGGIKSKYHSECCARQEATPAADYQVRPEVTGMDVNRDLVDELDDHLRERGAREKRYSKIPGAREPFASASSYYDANPSMFGMGEPRDENAGRQRLARLYDNVIERKIKEMNLGRKLTESQPTLSINVTVSPPSPSSATTKNLQNINPSPPIPQM